MGHMWYSFIQQHISMTVNVFKTMPDAENTRTIFQIPSSSSIGLHSRLRVVNTVTEELTVVNRLASHLLCHHMSNYKATMKCGKGLGGTRRKTSKFWPRNVIVLALRPLPLHSGHIDLRFPSPKGHCTASPLCEMLLPRDSPSYPLVFLWNSA